MALTQTQIQQALNQGVSLEQIRRYEKMGILASEEDMKVYNVSQRLTGDATQDAQIIQQASQELNLPADRFIQQAGEKQQKIDGGVQFFKRLKAGFAGNAKQQITDIETEIGSRGKIDVGDIADIAGGLLPVAGGIAGSFLSPILGSAAGAGAGQAVRRIIGGLIDADKPTALDLIKDVTVTSIGTAVGGKILGGLFNMITKTLPSKLVSTLFKQSADDIKINIRTGGTNLTQSEEVLKEGFRGSAEGMMTNSFNTMKQLELQLQSVVSGKPVLINNKSGYISLITDYIANLKKTSFGFQSEVAKEGSLIIKELTKIRGNTIPGELALVTRRFIDSVRRGSSFKLNPALSPKEAAYKEAADILRGNISTQISGAQNLLSRYKIHIDAFEDLAKYAAQKQNKDLFDLLDVFIMYGINPTAYLARRGLSSAGFKTTVAQGLYKTGKFLTGKLPPGLVPTAVTRMLQSQSSTE